MEVPQTIDEWIADSHDRAVRKGWYDPPKSFVEAIALMHSELSEALEEDRKGRKHTEVYYRAPDGTTYANLRQAGNVSGLKPEGIPIELADVLIRVFDTAGYYGIDLQTALAEKAAFNETRPFRHGNKSS